MSDVLEKEEKQPEEQEFAKADPKLNPRNQMMAEIAQGVAKQHQDEADENASVPSIDEDYVQQPAAATPAEAPEAPAAEAAETPEPAAPAAAAAPTAAEGIDTVEPEALYEVKVDGIPMKVLGKKLIDAGIRTFQKETAADYRMKQASEMFQEAERRLAAASTPQGTTQAQPAKPSEPTDAELASAIQFGTPEQASAAISIMKSRGAISPDEVSRLVDSRSRVAARDELQFDKAVAFLESEYGDLLAKDHLKRFFFAEEKRHRATKEQGGLGDRRAYMEVYRDIGDSIRREFNIQKPLATAQASSQPSTPGTAPERVARKAAAPSVPRTAASRLEQADAQAKVKSTSEIIATMQASRGKDRLLTQQKRG